MHREVFTPEADVVERVAELDLGSIGVQPQPHHHVGDAAVVGAQLVGARLAQLADLLGVGGVGEHIVCTLRHGGPPA